MLPHTDPALSAEAVMPGSRHGSLIPGAPHNISRNDTRLQQVVLNAAYLYNNQSNDAFLFKPSAILTAQRQVPNRKRILSHTPVVAGNVDQFQMPPVSKQRSYGKKIGRAHV